MKKRCTSKPPRPLSIDICYCKNNAYLESTKELKPLVKEKGGKRQC